MAFFFLAMRSVWMRSISEDCSGIGGAGTIGGGVTMFSAPDGAGGATMFSASDGAGGATMLSASDGAGGASGIAVVGVVSCGMSCNEASSLDGGALVCMKNNGTLCRILHLIVMPDGVVISQPFCLS